MMSKNLIYIVNINDLSKQVQCNDYAKYSLHTWEYYCKKHNIDLIVCTESDPWLTFPIWNKEKIWQVGKEYDKIGIVDSDTMIKWDAPDIFDQITSGVYGVNDLCDLNWLLMSINDRQKFYPDIELNIMNYLNAGVLFFTNDVLKSFKDLFMYYINNQQEIDQLKSGGKEQTLLNFQLNEDHVKINLLDPSWNLLSIHKKNMFTGNWQLKNDPTPHFIKYAYVWHFTGFPIEDRVRVMSDVWNYVKENYI